MCVGCGYKQDFLPSQENMDKFLNLNSGQPVIDAVQNTCPSCKSNPLVENLQDKMTVTIMGENELETMEKEDPQTKEKRPLTKSEKDELKAKIQSDILKYQSMQ